MKISHHHLEDHVKKLASKSVLHMQHYYFSSLKAIKLLIFGDALSLLSSFLKTLINRWKVVEVSANCDEPEK